MKTTLIILTIFIFSIAQKMSSELYAPLPIAQNGDWLYTFDEPGQTLKEFRECKHNVPDDKKSIIFLQPLESIEGKELFFSQLTSFTSAYFGIEARLNSPDRMDTTKFPFRDEIWAKQYQTFPIMEQLKERAPDSAFCQLAITYSDLYPEEGWNYVFGMGDFTDGVGVFSVHRYTSRDSTLFKKRCVKIISHETGHMFGLRHCINAHCNMNGANNLREFDRQPLYLCPVCLSKLNNSVWFNPRERYEKLLKIYEEMGFSDEVKWVKKWLELNN